ncbi:MAG: hypothetical protein HFE51_10410 [Clostridia bacterium]|nr:hypothetical protein [Clostridia bacterium]
MKKNFITGFITGGIICAAVTGFAVEYAVTANPYPVKINGVETSIQGYNINDETYFKLRDVSAAVGGFEVGFSDNTITIATEQQPEPTTAPIQTEKSDLSPLPEVEIETVDGEKYVRKSNIEKMLDDIGLGQYKFTSVRFYDSSQSNGVALIKDIPHHSGDNTLIPYDYYTSTVIPVINSLR